jgi:hypothetical protein
MESKQAPERHFTYFNDKPEILFKEYGRSIQSMVELISQQTEDEKRNQMFKALMEAMKRINPAFVIDTEEEQKKLWDQLHVMSGYTLHVDGRFPEPTPKEAEDKPETIPYSDYRIKNRHYGRNLDLLIAKAKTIEDPEERRGAVITLGKLIKNFYHHGNIENVEDAGVLAQLEEMSNGELTIDIEQVTTYNLFDVSKDTVKAPLLPHERAQERQSQRGKHGNNKQQQRKGFKRK